MTRPVKAQPRSAATRRVILDAALKLFASGGFNSAPLADIAREAGITQAGLLYHFPTKADLLLAVLQEREQRNIEDEERERASGMDWFQAFLHTLEVNERHPALVQLFAVVSAESITDNHPAHQWFVERYERIVSEAAEKLSEVIDERKLPEGSNCVMVARWLVGLADGLRLQWLLSPEAVNRPQAVALLMETLRPAFQDGADPGPLWLNLPDARADLVTEASA